MYTVGMDYLYIVQKKKDTKKKMNPLLSLSTCDCWEKGLICTIRGLCKVTNLANLFFCISNSMKQSMTIVYKGVLIRELIGCGYCIVLWIKGNIGSGGQWETLWYGYSRNVCWIQKFLNDYCLWLRQCHSNLWKKRWKKYERTEISVLCLF